jgi:hypothetical protein
MRGTPGHAWERLLEFVALSGSFRGEDDAGLVRLGHCQVVVMRTHTQDEGYCSHRGRQLVSQTLLEEAQIGHVPQGLIHYNIINGIIFRRPNESKPYCFY